jgi:N-acyl-D-aspartate/D-glutamate deacylase
MGERAFEAEATPDDLAAMRQALHEAMRAGAIGFTSSRSTNQETSDDRPIASRLATWSEVRDLVSVVGEYPSRIFQMALEPTFRSEDPAVKADAFDRMRRLALDTGVAVAFGVLPVLEDGQDALDLLEFIAGTKAAGGRMFGLSHSQGVSNVLSFKTHLPFDNLPAWRPIRELPIEAQMEKLRDPEVRAALVDAVHHGTFGERARGAEPRRVPFDKVRIYDTVLPPHRSVAEVAAERGCDPVELMIDLALESKFEQLFQQPLTSDDQEVHRTLMTHPSAVMTFSDSGAHVSQICDASIQTYLLAYWVRERQALSLEHAVHMITGKPAGAWGLTDRGVVREGLAADLNVLDPARILPEMPAVAYDLPAGSKRFVQKATGIDATVVGGQVTVRDGQHTGAFPGRLLRSPAS